MMGGGLDAGTLEVVNGQVLVENCSANHGGAVQATNVSVASGGMVHVRNSSAGSSGGGLDAGTLEVVNGQVLVENCFANHGGGIFSKFGIGIGSAGQVKLSKCAAFFDGGGLFLQSGRLLGQDVSRGDLIVEDGIAVKGRGGGLFLGSGDIKMRRGTFTGCSAAVHSGVDIFANGTVAISILKHHNSNEEAVSSSINNEQPLSLNIASVDPPPGSGVVRNPDNTTLAFYTCPPNFVRLSNNAESRCVECPTSPTKECSSRHLELEGGFMVDLADPANLSGWYRCPNVQACPGGVVEAAEVEGERCRILKPMCQEGFIGLGCAQCNSTTHARADRSVLQCAKCTNSRLEVSLQVLFYAVTDTSLFACAALSVLNAGSKKTNSGVLLNQLMAFTAVSGSIMSGMMQSQSFGQLQDDTKTWLHGLGLAVDVVQGQSSTSDMSLECVLHYFGFEQSLFNAHCLSSIMPLILIAVLAVANNPWLAMVVGTNVFLPGFVAFFGKYLVMLRLRPEKDPVGEARFEYLPRFGFLPSSFPADLCAITAILMAILVCGAAGVSGWLYTVFRHHESPPAHVKYLTMAYKPEFAYWEVERLVRKTFILLAKFTLPIMVSPALQMETIASILMLSVALYVVCRPYEIGAWNLAEAGLLLVALFMTNLTTCLLANDLHWAHSQGTQVALIFLICSLAGEPWLQLRKFFVEPFWSCLKGISIGMAVLIAFALLSERQERQLNAAKKQQKEAEHVSGDVGVAGHKAASLRLSVWERKKKDFHGSEPGYKLISVSADLTGPQLLLQKLRLRPCSRTEGSFAERQGAV
ncbi:unnamed protein product [Symbiodinium natans]|uniref:Uncharacterized protein n=1 Tax=Symbiodinium natans TaxID=878477 RepID=A0A812NWT4_9DINO|nr:unnamed protein product [Symbiodinium natans]